MDECRRKQPRPRRPAREIVPEESVPTRSRSIARAETSAAIADTEDKASPSDGTSAGRNMPPLQWVGIDQSLERAILLHIFQSLIELS